MEDAVDPHLLPMGGPPTSSNHASLIPSICCWSNFGKCVALQPTDQLQFNCDHLSHAR